MFNKANIDKGVSAGTMHQKIVKSAEKVPKWCWGTEVLRCWDGVEMLIDFQKQYIN